MTPSTEPRAIQRALRAAIANGAERVGPFLVTIDPDATGPFRNFAVPDDDATPTATEIDALLAYFAGHDRRPRLEFVAPAPGVEATLAAAGFAVDNRLALLVLPAPEALRPASAPDGVALGRPGSDEQLQATAAMQNAAYGEAGVNAADVARLRRTLDGGGAVVAATSADGAVVSAGVLGTPQGGRAEIYAVATAATHRRRGLASAVVAALSTVALDNGLTPYLQCEGPAEQRMYERLGYRAVGELIDLRGPVEADRPTPVVMAGEAETALAFLAYLRDGLAAKLVGLGEDDARRPLVPSGTSLLWLVKHVAGVEAFWLHCVFAGDPEDVIPDDEDLSGDTVGSVLSLYRRVGARTAEIVAAHPDLDELGTIAPFGPPLRSLRWTLVHLVEETGRHAGHADILRELIDGATGR
jgi:ribosomal protein S18 acetylase RimI-like enzyme